MMVDVQKSVPVSLDGGDTERATRRVLGESEARGKFRRADAVCFDVDSTVCVDEGIDELARFKGCEAKVAAVTRSAMGGGMGFRRALRDRLDLIRPSRADLDRFLAQRPPRLTEGIVDLVGRLRARGTQVYLVSGGFRALIAPVAARLGLPADHVYANAILFDEAGDYAGFDASEPTSDCGGKAAVCGLLRRTGHYRCLVMVGDGATDMEARPPADCFVGFGGNARRPAVEQGADWFVTCFDQLIEELDA